MIDWVVYWSGSDGWVGPDDVYLGRLHRGAPQPNGRTRRGNLLKIRNYSVENPWNKTWIIWRSKLFIHQEWEFAIGPGNQQNKSQNSSCVNFDQSLKKKKKYKKYKLVPVSVTVSRPIWTLFNDFFVIGTNAHIHTPYTKTSGYFEQGRSNQICKIS